MSADLREQLHDAAPRPARPLDVDALYQWGRRNRRRRVTALSTVVVVVAAGALAGALELLPHRSVPVIANTFDPQEAVADGHVSWREYRVAVHETANCLAEADADASYRFDETTGTFTFTDPTSEPFDECAQRHLGEVGMVWQDQIGPGADHVSWVDYRTASRQFDACLEDAGIEPMGEFDLAAGQFTGGYSITEPTEATRRTTEQAVDRCQGDSGFREAADAWVTQVIPHEREDRQLRALTAECLRERGIEVPDEGEQDTIGQEHPRAMEECRDAARRAHRPYLGVDVGTTDLADRIAKARQRWETAGIEDYRLVSVGTCQCPVDGHLETTVVDGEVSHAQRLHDDGTRSPAPDSGITIEDMFDSLAHDLQQGTVETADFDGQLGHPTNVSVIEDPADPASAIELTILELVPRDDH